MSDQKCLAKGGYWTYVQPNDDVRQPGCLVYEDGSAYIESARVRGEWFALNWRIVGFIEDNAQPWPFDPPGGTA